MSTEQRLETARDVARYKAWLDLMGKFTEEQRRHVANSLAHGWHVTEIKLTRKKGEGIRRLKAKALGSSKITSAEPK